MSLTADQEAEARALARLRCAQGRTPCSGARFRGGFCDGHHRVALLEVAQAALEASRTKHQTRRAQTRTDPDLFDKKRGRRT